MTLPEFLKQHYDSFIYTINKRLKDFEEVSEKDYFYELAFCLCTPQSKAENADKVITYLKENNYLQKPFDLSLILRKPENYIRFHNTKASRISEARLYFPSLLYILKSNISPQEKRLLIKENIKGLGMKESSHFLRNIGYKNLAILDRHILAILVKCDVFSEIPSINTVSKYLEVETCFKDYSNKINISLDVLDLLFWSYKTGTVLK